MRNGVHYMNALFIYQKWNEKCYDITFRVCGPAVLFLVWDILCYFPSE